MSKPALKPGFNIRRAGKDGKKFRVVLVAKNGEILSVSEVLNSRQSAVKNLQAQAQLGSDATISVVYDKPFVEFHDLTRKERRK